MTLNIKVHRSNYEKKKPFEKQKHAGKVRKEMRTDSII